MTGHRYALLLLVALAVAIAGCGDSDDGPSPGAYGLDGKLNEASAREEEQQLRQQEVEERKKEERAENYAWGVAFGAGTEKGMLIVDLSGHTLYTFGLDEGGKSTCYGACAETWPPALAEGKAKAGGSAKPDLVGTTKRRDGTMQVTYAGHPLYRYSRDRSSEINGPGVEAFGGKWSAIRPNGEPVN